MHRLRYTPLPADEFVEHRAQLRSLLPSASMVVIHSNDQMPTNADGLMPFRQNNNLYYLSGIEQEESILLLYPEASDPTLREVLFLKPETPELTTWEGKKLTYEEASAYSGIENIHPLSSFEKIFAQLMAQASTLYLESNEHYRAEVVVETQNARFIKWAREKYPLHQYQRLAPLMARLRATKSSAEVTQIRKSCQITEAGFRAVLKSIKPNCREYEIEATYAYEFLSRGAKGFAYPPIIASGSNACILHYTTNHERCADKELVLMDVGAEYGNYCADMTRTVPVNGRFSKRQRAIYESVHSALQYAKSLLRPGLLLKEYQHQVERFIEQQLLELNILTSKEIKEQDPRNPARNTYFMHGVSHHLGLDVHDVPLMSEPLSVGAVLTVEPGIYLPKEGIGIRLENDILLTETGTEDLMEGIPIEADAIEELMNA